MARIGKEQLRLLVSLGSPTMMLVVGDKVSASLVRRGLLQDDDKGGFCRITAAGLRALADEMEAGRVADALEGLRKVAAERRAGVEAKRKAKQEAT